MSATDPAGRLAAMGSELQNGALGADPADPGTGSGEGTPDAGILREGEPDAEDGVPSGSDAELGDRT
jgi:hypothetical protein